MNINLPELIIGVIMVVGGGLGMWATRWLRRREQAEAVTAPVAEPADEPAQSAPWPLGGDDLTAAQMGDYVDDPRIGWVGSNSVLLVDGRHIARLSPQHVWRRYRTDGTRDDVAGQRAYWHHIHYACAATLGDVQASAALSASR